MWDTSADPATQIPASPSEGLDKLAPAPRRPWGRWVALGVIAAVILVTAAFAGRFGTDPKLVDSPLIGQPVPDLALPFLERGGELSLRNLSGQVLVINFWASWCVACKEEHDDLILEAQSLP